MTMVQLTTYQTADKHHTVSAIPAGKRLKSVSIAKLGGFKWMMAASIAIHTDAVAKGNIEYQWGKKVQSSVSSLNNKGVKLLFQDHSRELIGTGVMRNLDTQWLLESLDRNHGELLDERGHRHYESLMSHFRHISFIDCQVQYNGANKLVQTFVILPNKLVFSSLFFADRTDDIITFSLRDSEGEIITGRGHASVIAEQLKDYLHKTEDLCGF